MIIGVGVVVILGVLFLRNTLADDPRRDSDLSVPLRRFARSAMSLITAGEDYGYLPVRDNQRLLAEAWDVRGADQARATLHELVSPRNADPVAIAWDLVRAIHLARMAAGAEYLPQDESWGWVAHAAAGLQRTFPGWTELANAFAQGRSSWAASVGMDVTAITRDTQDNIAACRPMWRMMPFHTRLA